MEKTRGIVIATSEATKDFLKPLLDSLPKTYPILVVGNGGFKNELVNITNELNEFECGALKHGKQFDEFIFLMDTCLVKNPSFIDDVFNTEGSIYFMEKFRSYLGKYESKHLDYIPDVQNKHEAVWAETNWLEHYYLPKSHAKPYKQLLPHFTDKIIELYGDKRCVIENDFLIKYKKYWGQIPL